MRVVLIGFALCCMVGPAIAQATDMASLDRAWRVCQSKAGPRSTYAVGFEKCTAITARYRPVGALETPLPSPSNAILTELKSAVDAVLK